MSTAVPEDGAPVLAPERQATFREVFGVREFRPLFGSFLLSTIGDELARVALTVLVYQRTESPLLAAITFAIGHLPWLLGGPLLSTLADRLPRHRVLIATDAARAVLRRAAGDPRHPAADPAGPALPDRALRPAVRVRPVGADGRRARGRPVRGGDVTGQHQPPARAGRRVRGRRRAGRRLQPVDGAADRRGDVRPLRRLAVGPAQAPSGPAGRGRRGAALAVAGRRGRPAVHRPDAAPAGHRRRALAGHDVRLRLRGGGRPAGRRARAGDARPSGSCWRPIRWGPRSAGSSSCG